MAVKVPKKAKRMGERPLWLRLGIYSHPGAGKTAMAGTAPRLLLLNADGPDGPEPIFRHREEIYPGWERAKQRDPGYMRVWDVKGKKDLWEARRYLAMEKHPFDWAILDSATLYGEIGMDEIMKTLLRQHPHRDRDIPGMKEYLKNQSNFGRWIRHMHGLPINFAFTAHVMRIEDQEDGEVTYMPAIQGGGKIPLSSKVCGYMTMVGRLYVVEKKTKTKKKGGRGDGIRVLQVQPRGKYYAKDRLGVLGNRLVRPTIPQIIELASNHRRKNG
jgi:hypothetical protein